MGLTGLGGGPSEFVTWILEKNIPNVCTHGPQNALFSLFKIYLKNKIIFY